MKYRGFTLVEMVAVIGVSSVLLALSTEAIHRAMRLDSNWRAREKTSRSVDRLFHELRRDVHQTEKVELRQNPLELTLKLADDSIVHYEMANGKIVRERTDDAKRVQREYYDKPDDHLLKIETLGNPQRIELTLTRDAKLVGIAPRVVLRVEAEVGRWLSPSGQGGSP